MGTFVFKLRSTVALVGVSLLVQPARSSPVPVQASAKVISSVDVWAQAATQMLLSRSPGVLILTIPGTAGSAASSIELTATGAEERGLFVFTASKLNAQLISQITKLLEQASTSLAVSSSLSTELSTSGALNGQGVQIAVLKTAAGVDGDGTLAVIITFD